ncbi:Beta-lactamase domain protein [Methylocella tundrae]|uniref:Beta-lactamase domain protein n=1 Tax=Methylocella tundrae TaxID=227605 RepID=A0A4U8Z6J5_METTU|nr:MBL fold metallo-hydrolase [Methylocella tundrae]VFU10895.1 Beta-lactamase domain protein [Methylocella tundrae]
MKVTVVGSGDAFGTGGRSHTCFKIDSGEAGALVDFGATSIASWKKLGLSFDSIDAIAISHLHGDHFGGLPFLLLDCQFVERRTRPLLLAGPPGLRERLYDTLDNFFPGVSKLNWSFAWRVEEISPGRPTKLGGFSLETFGVIHSAGSISTGLRLSDGQAVFAYSGDTASTEALFEIGAGADLFVCECYSGVEPITGHMDWPTLKSNLGAFSAKRMVLTHMGASALARRAEMELAGLTPAYDGQIFEV